MDQQTEFSKLLQKFRKKRGFRQRDLADACGIKQAQISQLESGKRKPASKLLDCLSKALQLTVEQRTQLFVSAGFLEESDGQITRIVAPLEFQSALTTLSDPKLNNLSGPLARSAVKEFADGWHLFAQAKEKQYKREWRGTEEICDAAVSKLHGATSRLEAYVYDAKGSAAMHRGALVEAKRSFQHVQQLLEEIDDPYLEGQLLTHQGELLRVTSEWREAELKFQAANIVFLGLDEKMKKANCARIDRKLGLLYLLQGDWDNGVRYLERSESVFQDLNDKYELAKNNLTLGWAYTMKGDWHRSLIYRLKGISLSEQYQVMGQQPDDFLQMQGHAYTGLTLHQIGSFDEAQEHLEAAKVISDKLEEMHERSTILIGLALLYVDIYYATGGKNDSLIKLAEDYYVTAATETQEAGDRRRYARSLTYQATLFLKQPGKARHAIDLLEEARRIFRALEHHYFLATVAVYLAQAYHVTRSYDSMNVCINEGIQEAQSYRHTYYRQLSELRVLKAKWNCYQDEMEMTMQSFADALVDAILFNRFQCEKITDLVMEALNCEIYLTEAVSNWGRPIKKYFNQRIRREKQTKDLSREQETLITDVSAWLDKLKRKPFEGFPKRAAQELQSLKKSLGY